MPLVSGRDLDRLIAAFNPLEGRAIIVPTRRGMDLHNQIALAVL